MKCLSSQLEGNGFNFWRETEFFLFPNILFAFYLPNCLHCVVFPDLSHPSNTIRAPRNGTVLHMLLLWFRFCVFFNFGLKFCFLFCTTFELAEFRVKMGMKRFWISIQHLCASEFGALIFTCWSHRFSGMKFKNLFYQQKINGNFK